MEWKWEKSTHQNVVVRIPYIRTASKKEGKNEKRKNEKAHEIGHAHHDATHIAIV